MKIIIFFPIIASILFFSCKEEKVNFDNGEIHNNVIIVLIDGARYTETWGEMDKKYIPNLSQSMAEEGIVFTNFRNEGITRTISGHAAFLTGKYELLNNEGKQSPELPNLFQLFREKYGEDSTKAMLITSKDKLEVLNNCRSMNWIDKYLPLTNCGIQGLGLGSGSRDDSATFSISLDLLKKYHPKLVLISFKEPDNSGHQQNWMEYLQGIIDTDNYAYGIWNFLKEDPIYKDNTTFFIVNDHGRHLDGIKDGFKSHGDDCEGCRHILLYAYGPDFKSNLEIANEYDLTNFYSTISQILNIKSSCFENKAIDEMYLYETLSN